MSSNLPSLEQLAAMLAANGREPGPRKHVLDGGWWFIDETGPTRGKSPQTAIDLPGIPAVTVAEPDIRLLDELRATAHEDGWKVVESATGPLVEIGGKRRARVGLAEVAGRGASLCVDIPADGCGLTQGAAAFVLRLTAFLRRVRASLLESGHGPRLVWETPLDPADDSGVRIIEALCSLDEAVRHGHAEATLLHHDVDAARLWLALNFPPTKQNNNQ